MCAIAFRVQDSARAYARALELGAWGFEGHSGPMELNIPAIKGVGDSLIYLVDRWRGKGGARAARIGNISIYDVDFEPLPGAPQDPAGLGLTEIDHLTHNVHRGRMREWAEFYERLFNFREVRYFDIEGQLTGVRSKAMTSPCGAIRIPINEEGNEKRGQIQEYLDAYRGEGIQHIALSAADICTSVDALRARGIRLLRHARHLLRAGRAAHPWPRPVGGGPAASEILIDGAAGDCSCRSSPRTSSARSSSSSSSASATRASARAISRRCSSRSSSTRCAAGCSRRPDPGDRPAPAERGAGRIHISIHIGNRAAISLSLGGRG